MATMMSTPTAWYAVYTKPNAEKKLYQRIIEQQLEAYLPLKVVERLWSDRKKKIHVPLFTSYVFARLNDQGIHRVQKLAGFLNYVRNGYYPATISEEDITLIKKTVETCQAMEVANSTLINGDPVIITKGPLEGCHGILCEFKGREKVALNIKQLDQSLVITLPLQWVIKDLHDHRQPSQLSKLS